MRAVTLTSLLFALLTACATTPDAASQREAELRACGLADDDSITADTQLHACAPGDTHKTTVCHIPPGNPANAHTLCVGNAAVPQFIFEQITQTLYFDLDGNSDLGVVGVGIPGCLAVLFNQTK